MSDEIKKPLILAAAARLLGVDSRWLRKQAKKGAVRSRKVGYHTIVDEDDVRRLAEDRRLVERALERQRELEDQAVQAKDTRSRRKK